MGGKLMLLVVACAIGMQATKPSHIFDPNTSGYWFTPVRDLGTCGSGTCRIVEIENIRVRAEVNRPIKDGETRLVRSDRRNIIVE